MKTIWRLMCFYVLLMVRTPLALLFNLILPLVFFGFYAGMARHAQPHEIQALVARLVTLGALCNGLFGLSINLVVMREREILRRYHLAPIAAFQLVASRLLASYFMFLAVIVVELGAAWALFSIDLHSTLVPLLVIFSAGYLAVAGIGFTIASFANTVADAQVYSQISFFGLMFLSGIAMPLSSLPGFLQKAAAFVPPSLTVVAASAALQDKAPLTAVWPELLCLAVISLVALGVATVTFRWETDGRVAFGQRVAAALILTPLLVTGLWLNGATGFAQRAVAASEETVGRSTAGGPQSLQPAQQSLR
jgi:ABC-2 type transport system permease protein